jgi:hypothetical protein
LGRHGCLRTPFANCWRQSQKRFASSVRTGRFIELADRMKVVVTRIRDFIHGASFDQFVKDLFAAAYKDRFDVIEDAGGDNGVDGYVKDDEIFISTYCPENYDNTSSERYHKKIRSDLNKVERHKNSGRYPIKTWYFVTPRNLDEGTIHLIRKEATDKLGIDGVPFGETRLQLLFSNTSQVHTLWPNLRTTDIERKIDDLRQLLEERYDKAITNPNGPSADVLVRGELQPAGTNSILLRWKPVVGRKFSVAYRDESRQDTFVVEGADTETKSQKITSERQYEVSVVRVNPNGSFSLAGRPVKAVMSTLFEEGAFEVSAERVAGSESAIKVEVDLDIEADGEAVDLLENYLGNFGKIMLSTELEVELSPRGSVISHRTSADPFVGLSKAPGSEHFLANIFPWLGSADDHSSWITTLLLLEYPKEVLSLGDLWDIQRDVPALGVRVKGVSQARLRDCDGPPGSKIAMIEETGSYDVDVSSLDTRLKGLINNVKVESGGNMTMNATWVIDVRSGQIQAMTGEMKGIVLSILAPGKHSVRKTNVKADHSYKTTWLQMGDK